MTGDDRPRVSAPTSGSSGDCPPSSLPCLFLSHSFADGTLVTGTSRGDAATEVLRAHRLRWSRHLDAWHVPRSRDRPSRGLDQLAAALRAAGVHVELNIDDTPTLVADREASRSERADQRAQRLTAKAERLEGQAAAQRATFDQIHEAIPLGQPILIGHHSARRHRRDLDRADSAIGRMVEAQRGAAAAQRGAEIAAAEDEHRRDPRFVARRVDDKERELRAAQRGRDQERVDEAQAQLDYWRALRDEQLAAGQIKAWARADIEVGDLVKLRGSWYEVARTNPKTVAVYTVMPWPAKYPYHQLQDHRRTTPNERTVLREARERDRA
jgi:hypothetical protein